MDKMLISILDSKFNDDFYLKKMKLNPLDETNPLGFLSARWRSGSKVVLPRRMWWRYCCWRVITSLIGLTTSFLQNNATSTIAVICTTYITKDIPSIWKWFERDPFVIGLLNARARFKLVVCIYDCDLLKNLFTIVCKSMYVTKMWLKFNHYMFQHEEVLSLSTNLMNYSWKFFLLALVENQIPLFLEDEKLYENEVCPEVTFQIIKLIFANGVIHLNIFGGKIFTLACLQVSAIVKWMAFYLEVF